MNANNSHRYTHLVLALGIVINPTVCGFITSPRLCLHDIGRATVVHITYVLRFRNVGAVYGVQESTLTLRLLPTPISIKYFGARKSSIEIGVELQS